MPRIIERPEWGAAPPRGGYTSVSWAAGGVLVVHHTEGAEPPPDASEATEARIMRDIQAFHQGPSRGWTDIGYHFIIFPSGRIYRGRPPEVMGAHSPGANDRPGVSFAGNFSTHVPTDAALASLAWLKAELSAGYLRGHRDFYSTECPGNVLYRRIHEPLPAVETPAPAPPPAPPFDSSLRLVIEGRQWSGWAQAGPALRWIKVHGLKPGTRCALAWRGSLWRGPRDVANVARSLVNTHLGG